MKPPLDNLPQWQNELWAKQKDLSIEECIVQFELALGRMFEKNPKYKAKEYKDYIMWFFGTLNKLKLDKIEKNYSRSKLRKAIQSI